MWVHSWLRNKQFSATFRFSLASVGFFFNLLTLSEISVETYLDVRAEVIDFLPASIFQVKVCPAQEQFFWRQFH